MKRTEFIREVTTWCELMDVCYEHDLRACEDIISEDTRNEYIDDNLVDLARENSWQDMLRILSDYSDDSGYDYYAYDDYYGRWRPLDEEDFENFKDEVLAEMDRNDCFDTEDDEDEPEEESEAPSRWSVERVSDEYDQDDDFDFVEEGCSFGEMLSSGAGCIRELECSSSDGLEDFDIIF